MIAILLEQKHFSENASHFSSNNFSKIKMLAVKEMMGFKFLKNEGTNRWQRKKV